MIDKKYNDNSKQFMQKILIFIDTVLLNSVNAKPDDVSKTLMTGLLNVRDALFSEIVRDNQITELNTITQKQKKVEKKQKDSNQEVE